jgi:hypothetical protein
MQRVRRLASAAVVASLAVAGLSACRSEPSVAAYVGDARITESQVQAILDQTRDEVAGAPPSSKAAMRVTRDLVVSTLVINDVMADVAGRHGVTLPADLQLSKYAAALELPETADFVRLFATSRQYVPALLAVTKTGPVPTEAEQKQVYDALVTAGAVKPGTPVAQFWAGLNEQEKQTVQISTGVLREIGEVAAPLRIRVNPRYGPVTFSVLTVSLQSGESVSLMNATLGADDSAPVIDAR